MARQFSDGTEGQPGAAPESTLASGITAGATSLSVAAGHGARFPSSGTFSIRLEDAANSSHFEIVDCSSRSTDTLTITATTFAWDASDKVFHVIAKADMDSWAEITEQEVWLGVGQWQVDGTSAVRGLVGSTPVALLSDGVTESVQGSWVVPTGWSTVTLEIWWAAAAAGAGDVVWRLYTEQVAVGSALDTTSDTPFNLVASASGGNKVVVKVTHADATNKAVTAGRIMRFYLERVGGNASDTLAQDAGFLGINIKRTA